MSWRQLQSIQQEAREEAEAEAVLPPQACPLDGTPLVLGLNGALGCPWCGWRSTDS